MNVSHRKRIEAAGACDIPRLTVFIQEVFFISSLWNDFMRRITVSAWLLAGSLVALGCEQKTPPTPVQETADQKAAEAKAKTKEAADATVAAAQAKRDEYAVAMRKQLNELDVKYAELKERAAKAEGDMKTQLDKKVAEAKVKRDAAAEKLDELKTASADRWDKIKDGVGNAFDDLKKAFE